MPEEPAAAPAEEQEPVADTPDPEAKEPAEETPQATAQIDWKQRHDDLKQNSQRAISKQGLELALLRKGQTPEAEPEADAESDEDSDEPVAAAAAVTSSERFESDSWRLVEQLYGSEAVDAYEAGYRILRVAETPADHVAAFEAYHEVRMGGGKAPADEKAPAAAKGRTKAEAVQPRVDTNQSDAGPDPSIDKTIEEAKGKGDLMGFARAAVKKMGVG